MPHTLLAWGHGLQELQDDRGAQPVIVQDLAVDMPCVTARTGL